MGLRTQKEGVVPTNGIVAVIPAKLTSVRLPFKNLADLDGFPMFFYSVKAAQLCGEIDDVYVSSEASEVLELAVKYGAQAILRPEELSAPHVSNLDVLRHALNEITKRRGVSPELMILLQPTHPLRQPQKISEGIAQMCQDHDADTLLTVVRTDELRGEISGGRYIPEFPLPRDKKMEPELYRSTGSFYIFRVASTIAKRRLFTRSILPFVLDRPDFEVDVDVASDLSLTRCVLEANREVFSALFDGTPSI